MKVAIDFIRQKVYTAPKAIAYAGWLGFDFARNNEDLVAAGWTLLYFEKEAGISLRPLIEISGAASLAGLIRVGPPKPCCHSCCCSKGE